MDYEEANDLYQRKLTEFGIDNILYAKTLSRDSTPFNHIPLNANAKKYGERGSEFVVFPPGISALTPRDPILGNIPESQKEYDFLELYRNYQRSHFYKFTSQELEDILATEKSDALPPSLWNATGTPLDSSPSEIPDEAGENAGIMPLLQRENWKQLDEVRKGSGQFSKHRLMNLRIVS